jgi:hypothetical protein
MLFCLDLLIKIGMCQHVHLLTIYCYLRSIQGRQKTSGISQGAMASSSGESTDTSTGETLPSPSPCVVQARRSPQARPSHALVGHVRAPELRVDFMSPVETRLVKARIGLDFDQSQDITEKIPFCLYDFFS